MSTMASMIEAVFSSCIKKATAPSAEQSNERVLERPEDLDMPPWGSLVDHLVEPELALPATDLVRRQAVQGRAQRLEERRDFALGRGMEFSCLGRRLACEPSGPARAAQAIEGPVHRSSEPSRNYPRQTH